VKSRRLSILFPLLILLLIFAGWFGLHFLVQSDTFRDWLSRRVSRSIHADGKFEPLTWEGSTFRSAGFSATGGPHSKLRSLQVTNISAHIDWRRLLQGVLAIDMVTVDKVDAVAGKSRGATPAKPAAPHPEPQRSQSPLSSFRIDLRVERLYVPSANLHWQTTTGENGELTETKLTAVRTVGDQWDILAVGGTARHANYPPLEVDRIHCSANQDSISILDAKASVAGGGDLAITGRISTAKGLSAQLTSDFSTLELNPLLPEPWRIGGKISGQLTYTGDFDRFEHGEVAGAIKIDGATFDMTNVFPTLRKLAKFGGLNDVRLDSIDTHLKYKEQRLELSDIHATSGDQIRVEGSGAITPDRLEAELVVGLSPKILGWIPGAEEKVFIDQRDGLRWAKVTISGSPARPKEDLTQRLIAAFRDKMTKEFNGETKDAFKSLLDMFHR
jgi:hypothetical protein